MKRYLTAAAVCCTFILCADEPSPPYADSQVQAHLRVNLENNINNVNFIRDNNDPEVLTKVYILKHADPYELRAYIRAAVQSRRVHDSRTVVECIKYNDGTGMLIVSAENYRFTDHANGVGIDTLISSLDQPAITASSGQPKYLYFPANVSAKDLDVMIRRVGANLTTTLAEDYELQEGKDKVVYDNELNCLFFNSALYSRKHIENMLKKYDVPNPEVHVKFTIYEIYAENDARIGADFQAWKNNDGLDLLSVGGRFRDNWTSTNAGGMRANEGSSNTQVFNFNPKWNSRYLDFLASKGHAGIVTSGEVAVKNGKTANIARQTKIFFNEVTETAPDKLELHYNTVAAVAAGTTVGYDTANTAIVLNGSSAMVAAVKATLTDTRYYLSTKDSAAYFTKNGVNIGQEAEAAGVSSLFAADKWIKTNDMTLYKGPQIKTKPSNAFGFNMTITPAIASEATTLEVTLNNTSLTGWQSSGDPRFSASTVNTKVMIGNANSSFIIGGLEKRETVRSVGGVPILKDLPLLGYLFSTESESTKRSQLVLVAECNLNRPDTPVPALFTGEVAKLSGAMDKAGNSNSFGFDQWLLDSNKSADWDTY
jgi:type II secretory pathway component GspD/PulD (secretin)